MMSDAGADAVEKREPAESAVVSGSEKAETRMETGPLVLRVKRRVDDDAVPSVTVHPKRVRLHSQTEPSGPTVFRLAGTVDCASDDAQITSLVTRAMSNPGDSSETSDGGSRPKAQRRRRRRHLRVVGSKKRSVEDAEEPQAVRLVDAEDEDLYAPSLDEYRRQLAGLTMNGEPMQCHDVENMNQNFVYDLYVLNEPTSCFGELFAGIDSDDDEYAWSLTLDEYKGESYAPLGSLDDAEWAQWRTMEADCDSNPDSESNWRNDYPDPLMACADAIAPFEEEEFDLYMYGREPERLARDSDDEEPLRRAMRDVELGRGVEIEEIDDNVSSGSGHREARSRAAVDDDDLGDYGLDAGDREEFDLCMAGREPDLEVARERIHGRRAAPKPISVRRLATDLAEERRRDRMQMG